MERLEDEAHPHAPQLGQRVVVERRELDAVERDRAGVGPIEARDEIEQRRLADPRFAHHGDVVAGSELEVDVAKHEARTRSRERLGKTANREHPALGYRRDGREASATAPHGADLPGARSGLRHLRAEIGFDERPQLRGHDRRDPEPPAETEARLMKEHAEAIHGAVAAGGRSAQ